MYLWIVWKFGTHYRTRFWKIWCLNLTKRMLPWFFYTQLSGYRRMSNNVSSNNYLIIFRERCLKQKLSRFISKPSAVFYRTVILKSFARFKGNYLRCTACYGKNVGERLFHKNTISLHVLQWMWWSLSKFL